MSHGALLPVFLVVCLFACCNNQKASTAKDRRAAEMDGLPHPAATTTCLRLMMTEFLDLLAPKQEPHRRVKATRS